MMEIMVSELLYNGAEVALGALSTVFRLINQGSHETPPLTASCPSPKKCHFGLLKLNVEQ
jgi:hypothetical protein